MQSDPITQICKQSCKDVSNAGEKGNINNNQQRRSSKILRLETKKMHVLNSYAYNSAGYKTCTEVHHDFLIKKGHHYSQQPDEQRTHYFEALYI